MQGAWQQSRDYSRPEGSYHSSNKSDYKGEMRQNYREFSRPDSNTSAAPESEFSTHF